MHKSVGKHGSRQVSGLANLHDGLARVDRTAGDTWRRQRGGGYIVSAGRVGIGKQKADRIWLIRILHGMKSCSISFYNVSISYLHFLSSSVFACLLIASIRVRSKLWIP